MRPNLTPELCACGCGVELPNQPGVFFARGTRPCRGTLEQKFWARVQKSDGCWLWIGSRRDRRPQQNYGRFLLSGKFVYAHRWSWELHFGAIPDGLDVLHHCDTPPCIRPDHLFLGDHATNMADKARKGRAPTSAHLHSYDFQKGANHPDVKLTEDNVREIRRLLGQGVPRLQIARAFGVSTGPIGAIARGKTWRHVN